MGWWQTMVNGHNSLALVLVLSAIPFGSCKKAYEDDKLRIVREDFNGDQLRIDGYYYIDYGTHIEMHFLYRNGVYLAGDLVAKSGLEQKEQEIRSGSWGEVVKGSKFRWGVFTVRGNEITYECWVPVSQGGFPTFTWKGDIQNETTFVMTSKRKSGNRNAETINEVYHFKQFSPKPDSTNNFVR